MTPSQRIRYDLELQFWMGLHGTHSSLASLSPPWKSSFVTAKSNNSLSLCYLQIDLLKIMQLFVAIRNLSVRLVWTCECQMLKFKTIIVKSPFAKAKATLYARSSTDEKVLENVIVLLSETTLNKINFWKYILLIASQFNASNN